MKLKTIISDRTGHIILEYDNQEQLSILWNAMSHSDNHGKCPDADKLCDSLPGERAEYIQRFWGQPWESTTVEIMGSGKNVGQAIEKRGWENPTMATPLEDMLDLLIELRGIEE